MKTRMALLAICLFLASCGGQVSAVGHITKPGSGSQKPISPPLRNEKPGTIVQDFKTMGISLVCEKDCASEHPKSLEPLFHHLNLFVAVKGRVTKIVLQTSADVRFDSFKKNLSFPVPVTEAAVDQFFKTFDAVNAIENNPNLRFLLGFPSDPFNEQTISKTLYVLKANAKTHFHKYQGKILGINFLAGATGDFANGIWTIDRQQFEDHFDQVWADLVKKIGKGTF